MELATWMEEEMREFPHGGGGDAVWLVQVTGSRERPVLRVAWRDDRTGAGGPPVPPLALLRGVSELLANGRACHTVRGTEHRTWLLAVVPLPEGTPTTAATLAEEPPLPPGVLAVRHRRDPAWDEAFRLWTTRTARRLAPWLREAAGPVLRSPLQPALFPESPARRRSPARRPPRTVPLPRPRFDAGLPGIVGVSRELRECCRSVRAVADSGVNVLLQGESGTGKEVLARAVHLLSPRREAPFVGVNCAALPETLFESELFGHKAGAFTGAGKEKAGLLEAADGGTFFLDEIGDMPLPLQIKLLRVMQERRLRRIGELRDRPLDVRFVAASHKDLETEIAAGRFRLDLYYRLKVVTVHIPPLRQRPEDVVHLLAWFLQRLGRRPTAVTVEERALHALQRYRWPGNVRELQNEVARWAALHGEEGVIRLEHLSPDVRRHHGVLVDASDLGVLRPVDEATELLEQYLIRKAIAASGGRKAAAARRLGLSRQGLYKKIKRYGMRDLLQVS